MEGSCGEGICSSGERADDIDGDDRAGDVGRLPARYEASARHASASGQGIDNRCEAFGIANNEVTDANVGSQPLQLVDNLRNGTEQQEWGAVDQCAIDSKALGRRFDSFISILTDVDELHQCGELDAAASITSGVGQPTRPLPDIVDRKASNPRLPALTVSQPGELEDVGMTRGNADDALAMAADEKRHMILSRTDAQILDGDVMMRAVDRCGTGVEQRPEGDDALLESTDTSAGFAKDQADGVVLGLHVSGAEAEHQPAAAQPVDGGGGPCQEGWLVELVVENQRPNTQPGRGLGGDDKRDERIDAADVVIREQFVVAEVLDLPGHCDQCIVIGKMLPLHRESERPRHIRHPKQNGHKASNGKIALPLASGHDLPGSFNGRTSVFGAVYRGSNPLPGTSCASPTPFALRDALEQTYDSFGDRAGSR